MADEFSVGSDYSRKEIFDILGLSPHPTGGIWFTGYARHHTDFYVFATVGGPGRTGHDYANEWEGSRLRWYAKTNTHLRQPLIQDMVSPDSKVHVFWRSDNEHPFTYAGLAAPIGVQDTSPVEILWAFPRHNQSYEYVGPDDLESGQYKEGIVREVTVNAVERSARARKECIEHYGPVCQACDLRFAEMYGELGRDFIHVHHIVPLSKLKGEYVVDPIADLRPVCPNCHAMIHATDPPLAVEALKGLIERNKGQEDA